MRPLDLPFVTASAFEQRASRWKRPVSQEGLPGRRAVRGIQITQPVPKLENQQRYVMDYEALAIAKAFRVSVS